MGIIAKRGEKVTCENGHLICEVAADIMSGEVVTPSQFSNWHERLVGEIKSGETVPRCPECSSFFIRIPIVLGGAALHIENTWRGHGSYANP